MPEAKLRPVSNLLHVAYAQRFSIRYLRDKSSNRSFAQAGEDVLIEELLGSVRFFIDIGANDGITDSNTFYFAARGSAGLCFEPTRRTFRKLSALYRFNRRVACFNYGISDRDLSADIVSAGPVSYLPESEDRKHSALHSEFVAKHGYKERVILKTFENAVGDSAPRNVDLLSIDVEGHELNVLRSIPFEKYSFRAIILETHYREEWRHRDFDAILKLLSDAGYEKQAESWVNTIFLPSPRIDLRCK